MANIQPTKEFVTKELCEPKYLILGRLEYEIIKNFETVFAEDSLILKYIRKEKDNKLFCYGLEVIQSVKREAMEVF